eukprot:2038999-Rhodomonas_salina.3
MAAFRSCQLCLEALLAVASLSPKRGENRAREKATRNSVLPGDADEVLRHVFFDPSEHPVNGLTGGGSSKRLLPNGGVRGYTRALLLLGKMREIVRLFHGGVTTLFGELVLIRDEAQKFKTCDEKEDKVRCDDERVCGSEHASLPGDAILTIVLQWHGCLLYTSDAADDM